MSALSMVQMQILLDHYRKENADLQAALCEVTRHAPQNIDRVEPVGTVRVPIKSIIEARRLARGKSESDGS